METSPLYIRKAVTLTLECYGPPLSSTAAVIYTATNVLLLIRRKQQHRNVGSRKIFFLIGSILVDTTTDEVYLHPLGWYIIYSARIGITIKRQLNLVALAAISDIVCRRINTDIEKDW